MEATLKAVSSSQDPVQDLVRRAREGDRQAFDRLVGRFEHKVMKTALFLTRNLDDAEDVAQEVWVKVLTHLEGFEDAGRIEAWIYRITVNACHDLTRKRRFWQPLEKIIRSIKSRDPVQQGELRTRLAACLARLAFRERAAFILQELHGMETAQVAAILECKEATVRGYLHQARRKMRRFLGHYRPGSE
ncbi:MAG TPA: RNA polymerase sigma factor [Acidobacteriota bacterium]|nr:RNA polymerase sigma factor [Acidobacteriota bacterium]